MRPHCRPRSKIRINWEHVAALCWLANDVGLAEVSLGWFAQMQGPPSWLWTHTRAHRDKQAGKQTWVQPRYASLLSICSGAHCVYVMRQQIQPGVLFTNWLQNCVPHSIRTGNAQQRQLPNALDDSTMPRWRRACTLRIRISCRYF